MLLACFRLFINRPAFTLFVTFLVTAIFASFVSRLSIDASAETLLLDNDKDLKFTRQMSQRFASPNFLIVTFTPNSPLLSDESLKALDGLTSEFEQMDAVKSTISLLNAPLLQSPPIPIKELVKNVPTIKTATIDKKLAKQEFLTSPIYKNNLISEDFKTTAIILNLKADEKFDMLIDFRGEFLEKKAKKNITKEEQAELDTINKELKTHRDFQRDKNHQDIKAIRSIMAKYQNEARLFLGGVNMIADDMVAYVKSDVLVYGSVLFFLLVITLWMIFRQIRFILIPLVICAVSVLITTGLLGLLGLEITVISSNFISLQLIITLSITLHLIVQYQEFVQKYRNSSQQRVVLASLLRKASPSFFAVITTIAGFGSLVFSNIKPIINMGLMMSLGIVVSLLVCFALFASINALLPKIMPKPKLNRKFSLTSLSANVVKNRGGLVLLASAFVLFLGIFGATKLQVENSFINYFKSSTEIYKGMKVIDSELGGTTPLDVILTFKDQKAEVVEEDLGLGDFEEEFLETQDDRQYWFSRSKMELISKVHEYLSTLEEVGNIQSLETLLATGKKLNDGMALDSFALALIYKELPQNFKSMILEPYVNIDYNQARFAMRVVDSNPNLRRDAFLKKVHHDLSKIVPKDVAEYRLSSLMVLYNNMLQSLFSSQIITLGFVVFILTIMFLILFGSLKVALIAMASNLVPMSFLFGFMGLNSIPLDMMSITIAAISVGIGVDQTIHYIHRFKDEVAHTKNYIQAMENSHKTTGYAMFYTSFSIILGFSVLVVSNFIPTIYFGLLTVLVMIMVLLGALFLLPKLLILFKPFSTCK